MMQQDSIHPGLVGARSIILGITINAILAVTKGLAGIFGDSYALIADAIESTTDIFASIAVWFGLRAAAWPPDENHPHGHGKAEPMAALTVGLFLFAAAFTIAWQSIGQIITAHTVPQTWTLLVLAAVVVTKEILFRYVRSVGTAISSIAVTGDAWHHRSDALTSGAAFLGILVAVVGNRLSPGPFWAAADDWAALFASVIIALNGYRVVRPALLELSDAKPDTTIENEVRTIAARLPEVQGLHKCVIRKMGFEHYVELDVRVDPEMPVWRAHEVAHQVQGLLINELKRWHIVRVLVHVEPGTHH